MFPLKSWPDKNMEDAVLFLPKNFLKFDNFSNDFCVQEMRKLLLL